jgi:hypothetical protein
VTTAALAALREEATRPVIVRQQTGSYVELRVRGLPVLAFEENDGVGRDVAIATILRLRFTTDATAALCGVSHGWVCKVRARLREGGVSPITPLRAGMTS